MFASSFLPEQPFRLSVLNLIQTVALQACAQVQGAGAAQPRANMVFTWPLASTALLYPPVLWRNCTANLTRRWGGGGILIIIRESSNKSLRRRWLQVMVVVPRVYFVAATRQQGVSITVSVELVDVPTASSLRQLQLFFQWCTRIPALLKVMGACVRVCVCSTSQHAGPEQMYQHLDAQN